MSFLVELWARPFRLLRPGSWFSARGLFDGTAVDRLEIVSEHHDLAGITFWFDQLQVLHPLPRRR